MPTDINTFVIFDELNFSYTIMQHELLVSFAEFILNWLNSCMYICRYRVNHQINCCIYMIKLTISYLLQLQPKHAQSL